MREAISNTAELGAVLGGKRIIDDAARGRMDEILREIREGRFAEELRNEEAKGYPRLDQARIAARQTGLEQVFQKLNRGS